MSAMNDLHERKLIFGVSITVTKENINEVTSKSFIEELRKKGCKHVQLPAGDSSISILMVEQNHAHFHLIQM